MREAALVLHERGHREGRGASARRVARDEDVVDVVRRLAHVVDDRGGHAPHHRLDVGRVEGLLGAVGRDAQRFAQTASGRAVRISWELWARVCESIERTAWPDPLRTGRAHAISGRAARRWRLGTHRRATRALFPLFWRRASAAWRRACACIFLERPSSCSRRTPAAATGERQHGRCRVGARALRTSVILMLSKMGCP